MTGKVEINETLVGGHRTGKRGRGAPGKGVVFGMMQRGGEVMTKVVPNSRKKTLYPIIEANVAKGTTVHTDDWSAYRGLHKQGYKHKTVNHGAGEYARGKVHVNGMENFWKQLKGDIRSTHIHVSPKHLHKYTKEFEFRFNRRENPSAMFPALTSKFPKQ